jgi:hypothetical protein
VTPRPHGKLTDVPVALRHLWSVLYRAVRRQARYVDQHEARLDALEDRVRALERHRSGDDVR